MRSAITFLATSLIAGAAFAAAAIGEPAPTFKGTDVITGQAITNADFKGKIVVVEWNNFECPFVKKFYNSGTMQELQENAAKDDVVWVTVNSSAEGKEGYLRDATAAKLAIAQHQGKEAHFLLDRDGTIGRSFGAKSTPHMFVIDKKGNLAYQGAIDNKPTPDAADIPDATNYVSAALQSLKDGKPIKTPVTQAYGCFVKY